MGDTADHAMNIYALGGNALNKINHNPIRKFLYGMALVGLILALCLGSSGALVAHAQAGWTDTPTGSGVDTAPPTETVTATQPPTATAVPTDLPTVTPPPTESVAPTEPATLPAASLLPAGPARPGMPPIQPHPVIPNQPEEPGFPFFPGSGKLPAPTSAGASPLTLTLGAPGLSFSYANTYGTTEIPYLADTSHLNFPWGIATSGTNVLIGEYWGRRVLKYTSAGSFVSSIGTAGTNYNDGEPYGIFDMAVDASGQTWIADNDSSQVFIYDASNNYVKKFKDGTFQHPAGIAFDGSGNVYVSDGGAFWSDDVGNQRVVIFDSAGNLLSTIGTTGESGSANDHLYGPQHIAIYANMLYIADGGNARVQIFDVTNPSAPVWSATLVGGAGSNTNDSAFDHPAGVAVNASYIFVADRNNNRVQVFSRTTRAYVSTLGGSFGTATTQFENPSDVAVDSSNNLYVADFVNCRVQQFNSSLVYQRTYGVTGVPYLTDNSHFNSPSGVAIAPTKACISPKTAVSACLNLTRMEAWSGSLARPGSKGIGALEITF